MLTNLTRIVQILIIVFIVFCGCEFNATNLQNRPRPIWNQTHMDKLKHDLLFNYDKYARPTQHYNVTTLNLGLTVYHVDIDEFKSTFLVNAMIHMVWNDEKLKWKSQDYGGIQRVNFAEHEIWQPDIILYNSALSSVDSRPSGTHCVGNENGSVIWVPAAKLTALCELNLKYWPFDTQKCFLKFGSWTYDGYNIDLQLTPKALTLTEGYIQADWVIIKSNYSRHSKIYDCCAEPYPDTEFEFTLKRRSFIFKDTIIALTFVIIVLTLTSFWLPSQAGEKILLNGFVAVIISMFMIYFSQKVPVGTQAPIIMLFYGKCLYLIGLSMVESIVVIWIAQTVHKKPLSVSITRLIKGPLGKLLCLKQNSKNDLNPTRIHKEGATDMQATELESKSSSNDGLITDQSLKIDFNEDWMLFANAIDRVTFTLYSFIFIILAIVYFL